MRSSLKYVGDIKNISEQVSKKQIFDTVYAEWAEKTYFHLRRILISHEDTDDALQNTFVKVWKHLDKFRGDSHWGTWIYRIASNEAFDLIKKRKRIAGISMDAVGNQLPDLLMSEPFFDGDEAMAKLLAAMACLPERQKQVFDLRYFEELSYKQIAKITETSEGALKASFHHAVQKIKSALKNEAGLNLLAKAESKE